MRDQGTNPNKSYSTYSNINIEWASISSGIHISRFIESTVQTVKLFDILFSCFLGTKLNLSSTSRLTKKTTNVLNYHKVALK